MKTEIFLFLVIAVIILIADETQANGRRRNKNNDKCKYKKQWSQCVDGVKTLTKELDAGDNPETDLTECETSRVIKTKMCGQGKRAKHGNCKYSKPKWSDCDLATNTKNLTRTLEEDNPECEALKIIKTWDCDKTRKNKGKNGKCKYNKPSWSACDEATGTKNLTRTLAAEQQECEAIKLLKTKPCKQQGKAAKMEKRNANCSLSKETGWCRGYFPKWYFDTSTETCKEFIYGGCQGNANRFDTEEDCQANCLITGKGKKRGNKNKCKYNKPQWTECEEGSTMKNLTKTLAEENPECETIKFMRSKPCRSKKAVRNAEERNAICSLPKQIGVCKGYFPKWYFDETTETCMEFVYGGCQGNENRFDGEAECQSSCAITGKRSRCKYGKPTWTECNEDGQATITRELLEGDAEKCQPRREKTKPCKKNGKLKKGNKCKYGSATWSECVQNGDTMERTATKELVKGGEHCDAQKVFKRPCKGDKANKRPGRKNGRERKKMSKKDGKQNGQM